MENAWNLRYKGMSILLRNGDCMRYGKNELTARQVLADPILLLAFGGGAGLAPKAPGTMGTLAAIPLYLLFTSTGLLWYSVFTLLVCISGIWLCGKAAEKLGEHDFAGIVWDEIAGYLVTLWFVPFSWWVVLAGFVLFRIFDILKPWPIRWVDKRVSGGFGIMLDDLIAGLFAALLLGIV